MPKIEFLITLSILVILSSLTTVEAKTNEEIYQEKIEQLKPDDVNGYYQLGLWCLQNKLPEQAKEQFAKVLELDPNHSGAHQKLGHIKYKDKWLTPDEMKAQGLVEYKGKWIPYDEAMKAQGYVKFEDQWITSKEYNFLKEISKKLVPPKGVLDKPGADAENLSWEQARTKETDHFIVKTNLSVDALNDIAFILECAYFNCQDIFGCEQSPGMKPRVMVSKNQEEYQKIFYDLTGTKPPPGSGGRYVPASWTNNKSKQNHLLCFYNRPDRQLVTFTLVHECTHYAMALVAEKYRCYFPIWLNEGWATYCEASIEGKRLVINVINQRWLTNLKDAINKQTYINLKDFINMPSDEYNSNHTVCYPEGWSLVYFLLNGQGGQYKKGFQAYMDAWKKGKIVMYADGLSPIDKPAHLKLFDKCIGVPIDQLEKEWKEYILKLK